MFYGINWLNTDRLQKKKKKVFYRVKPGLWNIVEFLIMRSKKKKSIKTNLRSFPPPFKLDLGSINNFSIIYTRSKQNYMPVEKLKINVSS